MNEFLEFINNNFKWLSALAYLGVVGLLAWFNQRFTLRKDHESLTVKFTHMDLQITQVKANIGHLPTKEEVHRLDKTLSGLSETINATQEGISRLERKTDLLLENELRND
ncbi:DUF2730 domain-containing protein [Shewanella sp. D64]|uniref:DUF2730 family protein n=1 Tax=unclassified Shewanella TaxID=196818 RepID=UPI0022BA4523|nr:MULTISPECIES: DUF2730 family protein [unclassified Shewanella]MEC4724533.1 DUF2730 domain-containing protein [Shewanella sp. D64]MEC4736690.1 DUF2730 domain-containing protein [Shewanella sp. E94]WBJ94640.1 DUF2730 domain-containing protein [Shewanella sp. MTB7]